jgi:4-amino-4-deoxy-L-arabinose transferase-like glycosyltransferase
MGRNIAQGKGVVTSYYHPTALAESGYPLGDVHVPGYALILGLSFAVFGHGEPAAFIPGMFCFLACGLLLFRLTRRHLGRPSAYFASLMFYVFPPHASYALAVMAEMPHALATIVFLSVWLDSYEGCTARHAVALAVTLGIGLLIRETTIVLLPLAVAPLWQRPNKERIRLLAGFGLTLLAFVVLVLLPFTRNRAPFPNFLYYILRQDSLWAFARFIYYNVKANVRGLFLANGHYLRYEWYAQAFSVLLALVLSLRRSPVERRLGVFSAFAYLATFVILAPIYPLRDYYNGLRVLMFTVPAALMLLGSALASTRLPWLRYSLFVVLVVILSALSMHSHDKLTAMRHHEYSAGAVFSETLRRLTPELAPSFVMLENSSPNNAFVYGWDMYPVETVWLLPGNAAVAASVKNIVKIDLLAVRRETLDSLAYYWNRDDFEQSYRMLDSTAIDDYRVLVRRDACAQ